jgi:bifunctional DNase/RNase
MALALTTSPPSMADLSEQPVARSTPAGFLQMFVAGVMPQGDEHTLVLVNPEKELLMPVGVGLPEAVSIFGRLEHKTAPRPLTHDLLENVVAALGASVVRVQIDDLRDGAFIGTVFLRGKDGRDLHLDARVSDAVVMALSAGAPIFVAAPVVARAALTRDDLERMPAERPEPPPGPTKTFDL